MIVICGATNATVDGAEPVESSNSMIKTTQMTKEGAKMNSQVLIDRVFLQDLLFLIKQPRTKIDARAVLVFGIERTLATPAPIPDAGGVVEFQSAADEAFREWEKDGNPIAGANGYMAASAGFREGAAWQARIVSAMQASAMVVPDVDALKAEIASLSVRIENSDAVISSIQKIITRLASSQPTGNGGGQGRG